MIAAVADLAPAALAFERWLEGARLATPLPPMVRRRVETACQERRRFLADADRRLAAEPAPSGALEHDIARYRALSRRASLQDVIGTLTGEACRPGGQRLWRCRCPGHPSTKPVLVTWPDGHAHCRRCGWHGDRLQFIADFFDLASAHAALIEFDRLFGPA